MIEAQGHAYEAEHEGALGKLASQYAALQLAATALERENAVLRAATAICNREHRGNHGTP